MNVILLTVFVGLILVALAVALFFYTSATSRGRSPEQDSLMPLEDEFPSAPQSCQRCLRELDAQTTFKR